MFEIDKRQGKNLVFFILYLFWKCFSFGGKNLKDCAIMKIGKVEGECI